MLLSEGVIVGHQILNSPVASLIICHPTAVDLSRVRTVDTSSSETTTFRSTIVQADVDTVAQSLNPWALHLSEESVVGTNTSVFAQPLILITLNYILCDDNLVVCRQLVVAFQISIFIVWSRKWRRSQNSVDIVDTLCLTVASIGTQTETEILTNLLIEVTTSRDTVITLSRDDRLVMIITYTKTVATTIGTTSDRNIMAMTNTSLIILILPIEVGIITLIKRILILTCILAHL